MGNVTAAPRTVSPLHSQIQEQTRNLDWTLAHFTFVANVTALTEECDIAHSPAMSVASCPGAYDTLQATMASPQPALAFVGDAPDLLANYAAFLADPGSDVALLVNEAQRAIVAEAFTVLEVTPEWQMVYIDDATDLETDPAVELTPEDWPMMQALAKAEKTVIRTFAKDPFEHGPAFGVWDKKNLVGMMTTNVRVPGAAKIGNLVIRKGYQDRGYDACIIGALVRALQAENICPFIIIEQEREEMIARLKHLGFKQQRPMYLMHCRLEDETVS
ncbi:MAG: hypothetical protein ACLFTI_02410 [Anaerolineales bacterium]